MQGIDKEPFNFKLKLLNVSWHSWTRLHVRVKCCQSDKLRHFNDRKRGRVISSVFPRARSWSWKRPLLIRYENFSTNEWISSACFSRPVIIDGDSESETSFRRLCASFFAPRGIWRYTGSYWLQPRPDGIRRTQPWSSILFIAWKFPIDDIFWQQATISTSSFQIFS